MTLSVFVFICRFCPIPCLNALFEYLIEDITHEKENMSKKRKLDDDHDDPAPKRQAVIGLDINTATDVTDAMDVAGFVPTEITKSIQRGYSHAEALVQIINNWPNSKRTTRRLQQWMTKTFGMDSCLEPSHSYSRFYELFVEPPERDVRGTTFYFASMPQMNEALLHWLQSYPADQIVHLHWNEWQKDRKNVPAWELPLAVFVQILERMISQRQTKLIPPESRFTTICSATPFGRHVDKYLWISIHEHRFHAYKSSHAESLVRWAEVSPNALDKQRKIEKWLSKRSIRRLDEKERSNLSTVLQMDMACVGDSNHSNAFYSISCNGEYSYFNSVPAACQFLKAFLTTFPEQTVHVTSDELCKGKTRMSLLLSKFMRRLEIVVEKKKPMILINDMYVSVYPQGRCQYVGDTRVWVSKYSFHSTTTLEFKKNEWYNYD